MRGRNLFQLFRPVLTIMSAALSPLPRGVVSLFLTLTRHVPTRLGIALRYVLVRRLAEQCGDNVAIFEGVYLHSLSKARFGDNVSIHPMCYIDAIGGLTIGSHVSIAHGGTIMTTEHQFSRANLSTKDAPVVMLPVSIGNGVWLAAAVRVLAGVTIGDNAVIGAGAVVTRSIPPDTVAVGVPARPQRIIERG
jgi:acetyltransferase-like isoleucine patch superfamily enzyme